jgi:hypothetical protein
MIAHLQAIKGRNDDIPNVPLKGLPRKRNIFEVNTYRHNFNTGTQLAAEREDTKQWPWKGVAGIPTLATEGFTKPSEPYQNLLKWDSRLT